MTASTERTHTQRNLYLFREPESQTGQRGTRGVDGEDTKTETKAEENKKKTYTGCRQKMNDGVKPTNQSS